ncbi:hypothetical protein [Paenibacillus sp. IITD108]|uniref:hypothetical protein n=1 Tax=Paenibacillus sp. IITD108 TaxID=3116649 RepID=UPI002F40D8CA
MAQEQFTTIQELSQKLNRSIRTLQHWVAIGRAFPSNTDTHRRDGGYVFSQMEVERLEKLFMGLSSSEAAKIIGITPQYLNDLALNRQINSELRLVGNREQRFYTKEDCLKLKSSLTSINNKKSNKFGTRISAYNRGARLFTHFENESINGLIVDTNPIRILCDEGYIQVSAELDMQPWPNKAYQVKKGFIDFKFPIPRHSNHPVYRILHDIIEGLGPVNVQIFETENGDYFVRCRSGVTNMQNEAFEILERNLISGRIELVKDTIQFLPNIHSRYVTFNDSDFRMIKDISNLHKISFDEALSKILNENKEELSNSQFKTVN